MRSQTDIRRVLRGTRSTAGGTPTLPETRHPAYDGYFFLTDLTRPSG